MKVPSGVEVANLDLFIGSLIENITAEEKARMPPELSFRFFSGKADPLKKMTFFQKWFLLYKIFKKTIYFHIADDKNGLSMEEFKMMQERKESATVLSNSLVAKGELVLSNNDFEDALFGARTYSIHPAYHYAISLKNKNKWNAGNLSHKFKFFVDLLTNYESNKISLLRQNDLSISDLYALFYFYDGKEKIASVLYDGLYKSAPGCNTKTFLQGVKRLRERGLIQMHGNTKTAKYTITLFGKQLVHDLIIKYVVLK